MQTAVSGVSYAFGGHTRCFSAQGFSYSLLVSLFVQVAQSDQTGIAGAKIADAPLRQMYQNFGIVTPIFTKEQAV